jgi:hypothetical protein
MKLKDLPLEMPGAMPGNFANQVISLINVPLLYQKRKFKRFLFLVTSIHGHWKTDKVFYRLETLESIACQAA